MFDLDDLRSGAFYVLIGFCSIIAVGVTIMGLCFVTAHYGVWSARKQGEAEYARAECNRCIKVLEAEARKEAAKCLADAEVIRAHGVAKANLIIGDSLKDNESYLRYLWIDGLGHCPGNVIYVPTEAGLPILEAGKRS